VGIAEKIKAIEDEIHKTQINKATEHHVGLLKAKMARLRREMEEGTHKRVLSTGEELQGLTSEKVETPLSFSSDCLALESPLS
jgi:ribosome-interacting GTPase 1